MEIRTQPASYCRCSTTSSASSRWNKLARRDRQGETLDATALVHEAYVRMVVSADDRRYFPNGGHFFAVAAEAMRHILVANKASSQAA